MQTLVNDAFENDPAEILEWLYGKDARTEFHFRVGLGDRLGQAFMNALNMYDPNEYVRLAQSLVDPFYDDAKIPAAIDKLTSK